MDGRPICPGRVLAPELMDDLACGPDEFRRCLVDLARVNRLTLAYRPTLRFLARCLRAGAGPVATGRCASSTSAAATATRCAASTAGPPGAAYRST